jgi:RHH-type proline utilization regulon transcriptional repressor/proline dehydrogenase/delta 1-pyrroline-5-carboxylate dehydrogenase
MLTVMEINTLEEGINFANATGYGLTSGLESLSITEQEIWVEKIQAGNLYINRSTTGAMVERQPFGGFNKSAFGRGIKAGGENYIKQFLKFEKSSSDFKGNNSENNNLEAVAASLGIKSEMLNNSTFARYMEEYISYFSVAHDTQEIAGQQNIVRFLPVSRMAIRILEKTTFEDAINMMFASFLMLEKGSIIFETAATLSAFSQTESFLLISPKFEILIKDQNEFMGIISNFERIKFAAPSEVSKEVFIEAAKSGIYISDEKMTKDPRLDLLHFVKEQSISYNYHRYGYIDYSKRLFIKSKI